VLGAPRRIDYEMYLIPYHKIIIETQLQRSKAIDLFSRAVFTHSPPLFYITGPMDYYARIHSNRFTSFRLLDNRQRNSFSAVSHGLFIQTPTGTEIHVSMYPPAISIVIAGFLAGLNLFLFTQDLFKWLVSGQTFKGIIALPIAIIVYIIMVGAFSPEAKRAEDFLNEIYQSK
jgi:hypothetical protein